LILLRALRDAAHLFGGLAHDLGAALPRGSHDRVDHRASGALRDEHTPHGELALLEHLEHGLAAIHRDDAGARVIVSHHSGAWTITTT
jgi:hypothetical protein